MDARNCLVPQSPIISLRFQSSFVASFLREARRTTEMSLREVEIRSGVSRSNISRMERGLGVTVSALVSVSFAYGVPPWVTLSHCVEVGIDEALLADEISKAASVSAVSSASISWLLECLIRIAISPNPMDEAESFGCYSYAKNDTLAELAAFFDCCSGARRSAFVRAVVENPLRELERCGLVSSDVKQCLTLESGDVAIESQMHESQRWEKLRAKLRVKLSAHGASSALAAELGVSRQAVSQWLNGEAFPGTEHTLALREWVAVPASETKQKDPVRVVARTGKATRSKKPTSNEKIKPSRKRP